MKNINQDSILLENEEKNEENNDDPWALENLLEDDEVLFRF